MRVDRKSLAGTRAVVKVQLAADYARERTWLSRPVESSYLNPFVEVRSLWSLLFHHNEEPAAGVWSCVGQTRGQLAKRLQSRFDEDW
jgi:hypothetical protein